MKNKFPIKILMMLLISVMGLVSHSQDPAKDVNVSKIQARMREADYLDRDLRKDKKMYIKGDSSPFTGTLVLKLGDYVEYTEPYENGILNGDKTWYDSTGNIMMIETYVDGKVNGEQITYYPNAKMRSVVYYRANRITGLDWYNQDGKQIYRERFNNGNGMWTNFYDDGKIHEEGPYQNFLKNGTWKIYNEKGNLVETRTYKNGTIIGRKWN